MNVDVGININFGPSVVRHWQEDMGFTDKQAMKELGIGSHNTWRRYKERGAPRLVTLAMMEVARLKSRENER